MSERAVRPEGTWMLERAVLTERTVDEKRAVT